MGLQAFKLYEEIQSFRSMDPSTEHCFFQSLITNFLPSISIINSAYFRFCYGSTPPPVSIFVLVSFCCITNNPKLSTLKQWSLTSSKFFGSSSRSGLSWVVLLVLLGSLMQPQPAGVLAGGWLTWEGLTSLRVHSVCWRWLLTEGMGSVGHRSPNRLTQASSW